jgi:MFS family permease
MRQSSLTVFQARLRRAFRQFTWGGEWAVPLPARIKHNLYWFFFDGLFASASDNIVVTYLVLYILALGATRTQIGLMSSLSSLTAALFLLPGALMVERFGHRKEITMLFGGGVSRLALVLFAALPFLFGGQSLVWAAIALSVTRDAFGNLSFPAWMSVTGEIIPMEGRGRYFASRNFVMGIAGMITIFLVGLLITRTGQPFGYQIALGLAFILGAGSTYSFGHLKDPKGLLPVPDAGRFSLRLVLKDMKSHPAFVGLSLIMVVWNFSINIAGPFFNVYMVQNLKLTASLVGIVSIAASVTGMLVQRSVGKLSDRWGPRKVQMISMLIIPIVPALWVFATSFWHVMVVNTISGAVWGVFNLVSFNYFLSLTPDAQRARYSAIYQILVTLALAGGAAFGAWVIFHWGYHGVFLFSAAGRMVAGLLFLFFLPKDAEKSPAPVSG